MDIERIDVAEPEFVLRVTRDELTEIRIALSTRHDRLWQQINEAMESG